MMSKGRGGVKNLKKLMTSFMNGPLCDGRLSNCYIQCYYDDHCDQIISHCIAFLKNYLMVIAKFWKLGSSILPNWSVDVKQNLVNKTLYYNYTLTWTEAISYEKWANLFILTVGPWADVINGFTWKIIIVLKVRGGNGELKFS